MTRIRILCSSKSSESGRGIENKALDFLLYLQHLVQIYDNNAAVASEGSGQ